MVQKNTFRTKIRNSIAGGLVGLLSFLPTATRGAENVPSNPLRVSVESNLVSDWVTPAGTHWAKTSSQNTLYVSKGPISGFVWYSQGLGKEDNEKTELDFWAGYDHKINDNLSLSVQGTVWNYTYMGEWCRDFLANAALSYKGPIDARVGILHMFSNDGRSDGESISASISKTLPIGKLSGADVSVTPELCSAYTRNFYGVNGFQHISPKLSISLRKGPFSINGFVESQLSLKDTAEQFTYGGIGATYEW